MTQICVSKLIIIGSDNDLSPGRRQAIIWTNDGILLIGPLGLCKLKWNLKQNSHIFIQENSFGNVVWKIAAILSRPQCDNRVSHPGGFYWDYCSGALYLSKISATHLKIRSYGCLIFKWVADFTLDGLWQEIRNSIANALELHLSCTNPLICLVRRIGASAITAQPNQWQWTDCRKMKKIAEIYMQ